MTHQNKISKPHLSLRMFAVTLLITASIVNNALAQTRFTRTTFNSAYIPITIGGGATSATATGDNANQTGIPIGFSFGYGDSTFTTVGLSTNGLVWFDAIAPAVATGNINMVTASSPNQSLAPWFNNLIDDASSDILYQLQGSAGSQTFTIQYSNYPTYTGVPGSNVRMNCQIILYETTNVIEFRYGTLNVIGAQTTSGGAFIGMEWGLGGSQNFIDAVTGSSSLNHRMLSPLSGWPSYNFRFTPGIPTTIPAGSYNVGVGQTYNSLTQAVADVNHRGITGAVTLNLTDAQYDTTTANGSNIFPIFVATPNGSATNLLTISKTGAAATLAYRGSSISASGAGWGTGVSTAAIGHGSEPLLGVSASYTTISNLNLITHGSPQTVEIGLAQFELFGNVGAQHNFYDKISIDLNRNHGTAYGIYSFSTTSPGGVPGTNSYNTWRDISIKDCNFGFSLSGVNTATGPADQGNQIITSACSTFNYIGDPNVPDDIISGGSYGILLTGQQGFVVRNCIIQNVTGTTTTGDVDGIYVTNSWGANEISNNIIHTLRRSNAGLNSAHFVSGIRINWDNQVMSFKVFNNSISNLLSSYTGIATTQAAVVGIYFEDTGSGVVTSEIYNNSVSIDGSTFPNASSTCLAIVATGESYQIKNNVFANFTGAQTGVATHGCFNTSSANSYGLAGSLSDYNNYYIANSANGYLCRAITTDYTTLAAWQAAMTVNPNTDVNSQVANPNFVNNVNDLHASNTSLSLNGTGTTPPVYITTDIDCETRTAPHDIGADQFTFYTYYADTDNDTYGDAGNTTTSISAIPPSGFVTNDDDCNDANNAINPGAAEICNGIDDNCNTLVDDGLTFITYYADADNDGYGDAAVDSLACSVPVGYVSNDDDCNDANNAINPGATEICGNSIDDDCDGQTDEGCGGTFTYYADTDNDTYGDPNNSITSTSPTPPLGYVVNNTDCNDANASVNPGASEICGNSIDDNCSGSIDENNPTVANAGSDAAVCLSNATTLSGNTPVVGNGLWTIVQTAGGVISQNQNPTSAFSGIFNKIYTLRWTISNAGCTSFDDVKILFANNSYIVPRPVSITGQGNALCGTTQSYLANPNLSYAAYSWSGFPVGTTINSQSGNAINVTFPANGFNQFQTSVVASVCGINSLPRAVSMKGAPNAPVISGPSTVCPNATGVVYTIVPLTGAGYNWVAPSGATIVSGQGTGQITVDFGSNGGNILCIAANNCGSGTGKKVVSTTCRMAQESSILTDVLVYPNPSKGAFNIEFENENAEQAQFIVRDMQGRTILESVSTGIENQIDMSSTSPGIYLLEIKMQETSSFIRLVKE